MSHQNDTDSNTDDARATRRMSLAELLQRSLEDDAILGPDDESERERWDDDEGSHGG
jgi:hypothetical protein